MLHMLIKSPVAAKQDPLFAAQKMPGLPEAEGSLIPEKNPGFSKQEEYR